jgi:hypothetical protein
MGGKAANEMPKISKSRPDSMVIHNIHKKEAAN